MAVGIPRGNERVIRALATRIWPAKYRALNGLDRQLEKYVDFDNGYYVELGANDGLRQSNTYYFERYRNWRGLLVEPSPHNFVACRRNRSPRNTIFCAACVSFENEDEFVRMLYADLMTTPLSLPNDIRDPVGHAKSGTQFLPAHETVFEFGAVARRLSELLDEAAAPERMDFLSLDVEGAEIEVLRGVDHTRYRFRYILVECRDLAQMTEYLGRQGYVQEAVFSGHDYLFRDTRDQHGI